MFLLVIEGVEIPGVSKELFIRQDNNRSYLDIYLDYSVLVEQKLENMALICTCRL